MMPTSASPTSAGRGWLMPACAAPTYRPRSSPLAILVGALLIDANLFGADLFGADLTHADLTRATLIEADLAEADLSGACLCDIQDGPHTRWPEPMPTRPLSARTP